MEKLLGEHTEKFKEETGITVEYETMSWQSGKTKQMNSMASRSGPDVGEIPSTYIPQFAKANGFMDVTEAGVNVKKSDFYEQTVKIGQYNGKFMGIPWFWGPRGHLSYTPLLRKAGIEGPPSTWSELRQQGRQFRKKYPKKYLFGIPAQENVSHFFADFLWQNGGELLDDDGSKAVFNSEKGVQAMNFYKNLQSKYDVMPPETAEWKGTARDNAFTSHEIQSTWAAPATVPTLLDQKGVSKEDINIAKLPAGPNGESASFFGLELVGIHPWTDHPEESAKWLEYLARPTVNADFAYNTGFLPAVKKAFKKERFQTKIWQSFADLTSSGKTFPSVEGWAKIETEINETVSGILVQAATGKWNDGDTRAKLDAAAKKANEILSG